MSLITAGAAGFCLIVTFVIIEYDSRHAVYSEWPCWLALAFYIIALVLTAITVAL